MQPAMEGHPLFPSIKRDIGTWRVHVIAAQALQIGVSPEDIATQYNRSVIWRETGWGLLDPIVLSVFAV